MFAADPAGLYLIALLFPDEANEQVRMIQREIHEKFGPSKSLDKPVHITLVPPFHAPRSFESAHKMHEVAGAFSPFKLGLDGFGSFDNPKQPVVFIKIAEDQMLQRLYAALKLHWLQHHYPQIHWPHGFHPHVTIAYRDVKPAVFRLLWPHFRNRIFTCDFIQHDFSLLRWEELQWVRIQDFSFA
ncbi:2'-5' RNA ligase family protein [Chitinophagaceae bacterium MMS25-I14]